MKEKMCYNCKHIWHDWKKDAFCDKITDNLNVNLPSVPIYDENNFNCINFGEEDEKD
jgi:hypothetical protein